MVSARPFVNPQRLGDREDDFPQSATKLSKVFYSCWPRRLFSCSRIDEHRQRLLSCLAIPYLSVLVTRARAHRDTHVHEWMYVPRERPFLRKRVGRSVCARFPGGKHFRRPHRCQELTPSSLGRRTSRGTRSLRVEHPKTFLPPSLAGGGPSFTERTPVFSLLAARERCLTVLGTHYSTLSVPFCTPYYPWNARNNKRS